MKNILKAILSIIAAVLVVAGVWAMSAPKHNSLKSNQTEYYYHYLGNTADLAAYQLQSNWVQITDKTAPGCVTGEIPCVVESPQNSLQTFVSSIHNTSDVEDHEFSSRDSE